MTTTILDTHLHLYPCYDLPQAFGQFLDNTAAYGDRVTRIACLAERHDCHYFKSLAEKTIAIDGFECKTGRDNEIELKRDQDGRNLILLPGRQVISGEKLEVLALGCPVPVDDGQPVLDIVYQIIQMGYVPVLPWSPGKWFGARGEIIKRLITELQAGDFIIGDTPLRPYGWPTPRLMKQATDSGFSLVAGSDPLPFSGEESWLGAYHSVVASEKEYTGLDLLRAIKDQASGIDIRNTGKRSHVINLFNRLRKNAASKKQPV